MRLVLLAHGKFPERAKTAVGILRYSSDEVVAVLDREAEADRVAEYLPDVQDAPILDSTGEIEADFDAFVIGIAPIGGGFDDSWRPDVREAIARGADLIAGLHYFLSEDEEFAALAEEHGIAIWDVRKPPQDLTVAEGVADTVEADVITTVGTDCSTGKMTASKELVRALRDDGAEAAMIPTGQTGIMIEGWGIPVDRVISDFAAGAVEEMILERGNEHDYLVVEGQGSITHPAYSGVTVSILHGSMPDKVVLTHIAGREAIHGYESFELPPLSEYVDLYASLASPVAETEVAAGMLHTGAIDSDAAARDAIEAYSDEIGVPATDPVRFGAGEILEAVL